MADFLTMFFAVSFLVVLPAGLIVCFFMAVANWIIDGVYALIEFFAALSDDDNTGGLQ